MLRETVLVQTFVELADTLVEDFDIVDLLTVVADRSVEVLDADAAGFMVTNADGELRVLASSSSAMRSLELFELQANEGPCLDAFRSGLPVLQPTLDAAGELWPQFTPRVMDAGFRSVHALPMRLRGRTIGALNLFRHREGTLDDADLTAAQAFADIATIAVLQQRAKAEASEVNQQLTRALNSRVVIEQAKGMISERLTVDMETAFDQLRTYARTKNLRLADVCRDVIDGSITPVTLNPNPPSTPRN